MAEEHAELSVDFDVNAARKSGEAAGKAYGEAFVKASDEAQRRAVDSANKRATGGRGGGRGSDDTVGAATTAYKLALANMRDPAEKLKFLRDEHKFAPNPAYKLKAELALTNEENRQQARAERQAEKDKAAADRQQAREQAVAAKAERKRSTLEGRAELASAVTPGFKREILQARVDAATPGSAEHSQALIDLAKGTGKGGRSGGNGALNQALGQFAVHRMVSGASSAMALGGQGIGAALGGNVSGALNAGFSGAGSIGNALMALGPYGMAAGAALKLVAGAGEAVTKVLDGLVEELGQYSAKTSMEEAKLEVATEQMKMNMAGRTEGLMVEWVKLKEELVGLTDELGPAISSVSEGLREMLTAIRSVVSFVSGKGLGDDPAGAVKGIGTYFNPTSLLTNALQAQVMGGKASPAAPVQSINAMMLDDLNVGGGSSTTSSSSYLSGGGSSTGGSPKTYVAPSVTAAHQREDAHVDSIFADERAALMQRMERAREYLFSLATGGGMVGRVAGGGTAYLPLGFTS